MLLTNQSLYWSYFLDTKTAVGLVPRGRMMDDRLQSKMIPCNVDIDSEAMFYREAFYHKLNKFPKPLQISRPSSRSGKYQARIVCYRCGMTGHASNNCNGPLPRLEDLEAELEKNIQQAATEIEEKGEYARDEFGCFIKDSYESVVIPTEVQIDGVTEKLNWQTKNFCLNCGEAGHTFSRCPHVGVPHLMHELDLVMGPDGNANEERIYHRFREMWG